MNPVQWCNRQKANSEQLNLNVGLTSWYFFNKLTTNFDSRSDFKTDINACNQTEKHYNFDDCTTKIVFSTIVGIIEQLQCSFI